MCYKKYPTQLQSKYVFILSHDAMVKVDAITMFTVFFNVVQDMQIYLLKEIYAGVNSFFSNVVCKCGMGI